MCVCVCRHTLFSHITPTLTRLHYIERQQSDSSQTSCLLHEGRHLASEVTGQADVSHQLHGDGQSDRRTPQLLAVERTTNQSGVSAS